jgi:methionyl-tRNA formyltransferase
MPPSISVVFFGTPEYGVPTLRGLAANAAFELRAVVTQPDRPAGRGHELVASPVKRAAIEISVPVLQPQTLRDETVRSQLRDLDADLFVVAAYGLIFGKPILEMPRFGCVNLHASILPAYRGAAPVSAAILSGDPITGVSLMEMERGLDTGAVISDAETPILPTDTTDALTARLADLGATLAMRDLPRYVSDELTSVPQTGAATVVRQLTKADGEVDWTHPAEAIERHVRAMWPWPRAWTRSGGLVLQIHQAHIAERGHLPAGALGIIEKSIAIGTGTRPLIVEVGQLPGGRPLSGQELAVSQRLQRNLVFEPKSAPAVPLIRPAE